MNERKQYPYQDEEPKVIALAATKTVSNYWLELAFGASILAYGLSLLIIS